MQGWEQQRQAAVVALAAAAPKPPGLELKVAFSAAVQDTQAAYSALTQALGGLLCASVATTPQLAVMAAPAVGWFSHQPPAVAVRAGMSGDTAQPHLQQQQRPSEIRQVYAWLSQEGVCTENLAAWRRLLPCRGQAGLAALLQPVHLAAAPYYSLGLQLQVVQPAGYSSNCSDSSSSCNGSGSGGGGPRLELRQVLTAILLPHAADATKAQQPQRHREQEMEQGVLEAVFGSGLPPACPATTSSTLYVALPGTAAAPSGTSCSLQQTPAGPLLACDALLAPRWHLPASTLQPGNNGGNPTPAQQQREAVQVVQHAVQRGSQAGTLVVGVRVQEQAGGGALLHVMQLLPWHLMVDAPSLRLQLDSQVGGAGGAGDGVHCLVCYSYYACLEWLLCCMWCCLPASLSIQARSPQPHPPTPCHRPCSRAARSWCGRRWMHAPTAQPY